MLLSIVARERTACAVLDWWFVADNLTFCGTIGLGNDVESLPLSKY